MSTVRQKEAARRNLEKARQANNVRAHGAHIAPASGLSTAEKDRIPASEFAFPAGRKEPLVDAEHVRNAVARFDQVEGVSDEERDAAWNRIRYAADRYGVEIEAGDWRQLFVGGKERKH
jgi:hypothetical protein